MEVDEQFDPSISRKKNFSFLINLNVCFSGSGANIPHGVSETFQYIGELEVTSRNGDRI
jgi:hypothetical protein